MQAAQNNNTPLHLLSLKEDPNKFEEIIRKQQELSIEDEQIRQLLDSIFLEKNRDLSFERFLNSLEFKTINKLLTLFNVAKQQHLCEIGGGPGFLTWALRKTGYENLDICEPNAHFNTGTGYLSTRKDIENIKIHHDLDHWHNTAGPYDVVITKNCIHHFPNIAQSAAIIRQKMQPDGLWFSFREWFADTPQELYSLLTSHPYCQPHQLYEWPFPASHYAEAIEIAGFQLIAVVPFDYANNCLGTWSEGPIPPKIEAFTHSIDRLLLKKPQKTVEKFWNEVIKNKFHGKQLRCYTRPQLMLFRKIAI
ncbi:MAG: class I SAM-dependent methyltransferase [Gammaproteobacteria bacterium]